MGDQGRQTPLFSQSPMGILVLDRQGQVVNVNEVGCRDLARARERIVGQPFSGWILPGDSSRAQDALEMVMAGQATRWRGRIRRGDGLPRVHRIHGVPLLRDGGVEGALLFLKDITESGQGRPELRQFQELLENLPGQFVVLTDRGGKIRYSSGLGRTHFRDSSTILGTHFRELVGHEREGEENVADLLRSVGEGKSWGGVQWHRRKDGVSFPVEVFASPQLDTKTGQVLGVMVVGRDLSPVRKFKELATRNEPLAHIGSLVGRIAQELEGGVDRLREALGDPGDESPDSLEAGREELRRMRRFLEGIQEFGSRGVPRPRSLSLAERAHLAVERASGRMGSLGIQPILEVPPNVPQVFADEGFLDRILDIVMENALDAAEVSPIPLLRLEVNTGPEGVILRVTNSGSTLQKDWLDQVFDPFFTTRQGHSGLGLAIARGMMEAHQGRIWAEIPQDGFLTMALEFPKEAPDRVRPFRPSPLRLSRSRTVLVVDDDEAIRVALRTFLEKVGYQVKEAWSGRSALAQLTAGRLPEVVLTDLKMSDGNGYWFLEELGREHPKLVSRTIIITGDVDHEAAHDLSAQTGCPLVRKPFELPELLEVLDQVGLKN